MKYDYDFAIVGAGASGLIAADFALKLGARVVMIEKDRIGGDCTWSGCVPSKSLIKAASVAHAVQQAARFGVGAEARPTDMPQVRAWLNSTIEHIYAPTTPEALRAKGMQVLLGAASFTDAHTLQVGEQRITAGKVLINTGARPHVPDIAGLDCVPFMTYKEIFQNARLPRRLLVVGGGPIGCEIAQSYRRLGAKVTLIANRLLPEEEPEASAVLEDVFAVEGVDRIHGRATAVCYVDDLFTLNTSMGDEHGDMLLIATGRVPVVEGLGLERAGVRYTVDGITIDAHLRTSASNIYAAGDVLGGPQYSHLAGWQGFQATRNALLPGKAAGTPRAMPRVTFTSPEVARIGMTERQARQAYGDKLQTGILPLARVDRAVSEDDTRGFNKLLASQTGQILGATLVGERASEAITEVVMAMDRGIKLEHLAGVVHPYPTYAIGLQFLATEMAMRRTFASFKGRMLCAVSRFYR
jgi:pyruvate/2-oxoglutarate dehydrogenase complex dihydrolipoamide dehydrogenase (E3) component